MRGARSLACGAVLAVLCAAPAARAETAPLTAEAFDALTVGKTMDTATSSGIYGVETFLPGRKVIWRDANRCVSGTWQAKGPQICFLYEDKPDHPVCWSYFDEGDRIRGLFEGEEDISEPIFLTPGEGPVSCDGYLGA